MEKIFIPENPYQSPLNYSVYENVYLEKVGKLSFSSMCFQLGQAISMVGANVIFVLIPFIISKPSWNGFQFEIILIFFLVSWLGWVIYRTIGILKNKQLTMDCYLLGFFCFVFGFGLYWAFHLGCRQIFGGT